MFNYLKDLYTHYKKNVHVLHDVMTMFDTFGNQYSNDYNSKSTRKFLNKKDVYIEAVYADNELFNTLKGFMVFTIYDNPFNGVTTCSELMLFVHPEHRNTGTAQDIIANVINKCKAYSDGIVFEASTSIGWKPSAVKSVYESAGFETIGYTFKKEL